MSCKVAAECSGCSQWGKNYSTQVFEKNDLLQLRGQALGFAGKVLAHNLGPKGIRDRGDLQWRRGEGWGFLNKEFKNLKVIESCPLFSKDLQELFHWWRRFSLHAQKASVRLRVDPQGQWGVWLDLANIDVKDLLQQDSLLAEWTSQAHIEIGQRFKVLKKVGPDWKLTDPELRPWFETVDLQGNKYSLFGSIGSFSQVGLNINRKLVQRTLELARSAGKALQVLELGAGAGNFTLGLAAEGFKVIAVEQHKAALVGMERALFQYPNLGSKIKMHTDNFLTMDWGDFGNQESILFLDPPRSGVGESLLQQIPGGNFPFVMYVSCGVESWARDGKMLKQLGYEITHLEWVDQFPNTPLYEVISLWRKRA
jgi:23S rRNA (uracil1939-C5)-methyltransferase